MKALVSTIDIRPQRVSNVEGWLTSLLEPLRNIGEFAFDSPWRGNVRASIGLV